MRTKLLLTLVVVAWTLSTPAQNTSPTAGEPDLWELARQNTGIHRFSTLFTAQDVRSRLCTEAGIDAALGWCKRTAVTQVFIESFRDGYQAERAALSQARDRFRNAGFEVSGCITPTRVGKSSTGWKNTISCYTDKPTQEKLKSTFEYAVSLFDEIMIDDFWFTDCACPECDASRHRKQARVGDREYPVSGDTWEDYRCELMVRLSRDYVLEAARKVNPKARLIIKYPQWYDNFHERGYEVVRQTADFDRIWVGTETRDYADPRWGGTVQYEAYFIMRWLGGLGGAKCGGGWYDPYGTTERTYVEQARQTVLGGARQSLLFCYGSLQNGTGPKNIEALRTQIPELFEIAREVSRREIIGVAAYKPPNSHPEKEKRVYDFVGMLGVPLVPVHEFPAEAPALFLPVHALKDSALIPKLTAYVASGRPVLLTDGLAATLAGRITLEAPNVRLLPVKGDPKSLLELPQQELDTLRAHLLRPLRISFKAPNQVSLYLFKDGSRTVENFNDRPVDVQLDDTWMTVGARSWKHHWR